MRFFTEDYRNLTNYINSRLPQDLQFNFAGAVSCSDLPSLMHAKLSRTVTRYSRAHEHLLTFENKQLNSLWGAEVGSCYQVKVNGYGQLTYAAYEALSITSKIADDLLQPIWGVVRLLTAAAYVVAVPFHVLESIYQEIRNYDQDNALMRLERTLVWLIYAIENVLCGAIELVTTPLTYFYRIPLRLLLTAAGEKNQSTGLTVGSALLVTGGMTLALWEGFAHFFPTLSGMAQQAVNHLGAQAMPIIQHTLLGMAAAGAAIALISLASSLATTHCKQQSASDEDQGDSAPSSPLLASDGR